MTKIDSPETPEISRAYVRKKILRDAIYLLTSTLHDDIVHSDAGNRAAPKREEKKNDYTDRGRRTSARRTGRGNRADAEPGGDEMKYASVTERVPMRNADFQANLTNITKQYANTNNGGRERITRDGDSYYISSDFGKGFCDRVRVSRRDAERYMAHTYAPASVVFAILGTEVSQ